MDTRRMAAIATVAVALLTAALLAVLPTYRSESCSTVVDGPVVCSVSTETLIEHEGASVLVVLLVPAGIALIGLVHPRALRLVAIALTAAAMLAAMSIGMFFLPTVAAAWFAATRHHHGS